MEHDFAEWKHRLRVYGLDFRDIPMVHHFCDHIKRTYPRLDMIINNAAQTVRRPPAFYRHLLEEEMRVPGDGDRELLVDYHHYEPRDAFILKANKDQAPAPALPGIAPVVQASIVNVEEGTATTAATENSDSLLSVTTAGPSKKAKTEGSIGGVCTSVLLSQVALMQGDEDQATDLFPPGRYDIDNQQVDLRSQNSWTMRIGEVSTVGRVAPCCVAVHRRSITCAKFDRLSALPQVELIECHAINAFAPWVLCSELRSMLADKSQGDDWVKDGRYIVNVSAMEAQFYRHKTPGHPHTNMAKASLNMLTRTSAQDFLQDGIYLNSVDTGWITDENCAGMSKMHSDCPLDEWDAALRILDPVFEGIRNPENRHFGLFLKNYKPTRW